MSFAEGEMENGEGVAFKPSPAPLEYELTRLDLYNLTSSPQEVEENKRNLDKVGGVKQLAKLLRVNLSEGLPDVSIEKMRQKYGSNEFSRYLVKSPLIFFVRALNDPILIVLMCAAILSCSVHVAFNGDGNCVEGASIAVAVLVVVLVSAANDYAKEKQFEELYSIDFRGQETCVLRNGEKQIVPVMDLVVGDIVILREGDQIPADGILFEGRGLTCNESTLTGESHPKAKDAEGADPFIFSSCLVSEIRYSTEVRMIIIGLGSNAEWGKIHESLAQGMDPTPLQKRLEKLALYIGIVGLIASIATFLTLFTVSMVAYTDGDINRDSLRDDIIEAFIISITLIVVAIPEGLPLAVTISLAYSTMEMYKTNNLVRRLASCEILGNATIICTDKTGTLTENRMRATEAYTGCHHLQGEELCRAESVPDALREMISQNIACNTGSELLFKGNTGNDEPTIVGSPTEGALLLLANGWGVNTPLLKKQLFNIAAGDRVYPFTAARKQSTVIVHLEDDKGVRVYCKGASEVILDYCVACVGSGGLSYPMDDIRRADILSSLNNMAGRALRTICLAHKDYKSAEDLPEGWETDPPDDYGLMMDAIIGIQDGLRCGAIEAVATAQQAGIRVCMITGDNIHTAKAVAASCGILTNGGIAMTGNVLRSMTPKELDDILPDIQVVARASANDKQYIVSRLNGMNLPKNEEEWLAYHDPDGSKGLSWMEHRDILLPGYVGEWMNKPNRGEIVGVTGDGVNDAPALRVADVGIGMGKSGTKVALLASDIVLLDDEFASIINAISWGRCVYDNIRKFLQFQITVNIVAIILVFVGSVTQKGAPLGAVMMLWVNLIMDSMGALALGTDHPTPDLLNRKPYAKEAPLISAPMWRNIIVQAIYQLCILMWFLYSPQLFFGDDLRLWNPCVTYELRSGYPSTTWDPTTGEKDPNGTVGCSTFYDACGTSNNYACFENNFETFADFEQDCLKCDKVDYTHYTIIFNTFVFCQIFNEFNCRSVLNDYHVLRGVSHNRLFWAVIFVTIGCQIMIVEVGGEVFRTEKLSPSEWLISSAFGLGAIPTGMIMRFIPVYEDPRSFVVGNDVRIHNAESHDLFVPYEYGLPQDYEPPPTMLV